MATLSTILLFGQAAITALLTLLLFAVLLLRGRQQFRRAVVALALGALILLLAGTAIFDAVFHLQTFDDYSIANLYSIPATDMVQVAFILVNAGFYLNVGAAILGLARTAWTGRWGWFAAILIALVVAFLIGDAPYTIQVSQLALFNPPLWENILHCGPAFAGINPGINPCNPQPVTAFYLILSVLTVTAPLVPLLYGLRGPDAPKASKPDPVPA